MSTASTRTYRRFVQATATTEAQPSSTPENHFTPRSIPMATSNMIAQPAGASNTSAWLSFTYAQFGAALLMAGLGIWFLPVDLGIKGYMLMSNVFLIGSAFTLSKTVRDEHESRRFANRLEEARTEKLLMEVGRVS